MNIKQLKKKPKPKSVIKNKNKNKNNIIIHINSHNKRKQPVSKTYNTPQFPSISSNFIPHPQTDPSPNLIPYLERLDNNMKELTTRPVHIQPQTIGQEPVRIKEEPIYTKPEFIPEPQ